MKSQVHSVTRLLLGGALALSVLPASAAFAQIQVDVNNREVPFGNVGPARYEGRVFIPLRAVVEALGADVRWNAATQTVHGSKGSREFSLPIGSHTARVNGDPLELDAPARLVAGNTMVPLRFVAEALGADVNWNGPTQSVSIFLADARNDRPRGDRDDFPRDRPRRDRDDFPRDRDRDNPRDRDRDRDTPREDEMTDAVAGQLVSIYPDATPPTITVRTSEGMMTYRLDPDTIVRRGEPGERGQRVDAEDLRRGDRVRVLLDGSGKRVERIDSTPGRERPRPGRPQ